MGSGECQICGAQMRLETGVVLSELIECADCGTEYEVVGKDPIRLVEAPQEAEDWGE
ncbi:MAG: lysine biosynthesis protein LysW [Planctomycetota bacterium]